MNAAPQEFSRTEERTLRYARTIRRAFLITVALHLACALALNPSLLLRWFGPRTLLGYPGGSRSGDLGPQGTPGRPHAPAFRSQHFAGPSTLIHLEVATGTPSATPARQAADRKSAGTFERMATAPWTDSVAGGQDTGVHFELDENGSVIGGSGGSGGVARSQKFQTLKIVRPEYPRAAIRAGIEGLVRLEVQVDTTGNVVGVRTAANITASGEMEEAAIRAMRLWLFLPYREKSRPVPFTLIVPFRYRLVD